MGIIERITEAEAARDLTAILERVRTQGVTFEIVDGDRVVARLAPSAPAPQPTAKTLGEFMAAWQTFPRLDPDDAAKFEEDLAEIRQEMKLPDVKWD